MNYITEFKSQALELVRSASCYAEAARQLGIKDNLLHSCKKRFNFSLDPKGKGKKAAEAVPDAAEVRLLNKRIAELEKTNYIFKGAAVFFSGLPEMKFKMVEELAREQQDLILASAVFEVSRSGHYKWLDRPLSVGKHENVLPAQ